MKKMFLLLSLSILLLTFVPLAFASDDNHKHDYKGHFSDMDLDGDDQVNLKEFKKFFKHAQEDIFKKADGNKDGLIDHDEWHEFKAEQGYTHE